MDVIRASSPSWIDTWRVIFDELRDELGPLRAITERAKFSVGADGFHYVGEAVIERCMPKATAQ